MARDPEEERREEARRAALRRVDPEFLRRVLRGVQIAQQLQANGELLKLDAVLGQSGGTASHTQGAEFIRGQASLLRESASLQAELADIYDEMGALLDRQTGT